jgi:CheY-like chemotaxis protein
MGTDHSTTALAALAALRGRTPHDAATACGEMISPTEAPADAEERRGLFLLIEDDRGDQVLTREALRESGLAHEVVVLSSGEEALHYLRHKGRYSPPAHAPRPDLILLDLNMPRISGRQVAAQLKEDPGLRSIPVIVLSTSGYSTDVRRCYEEGVNSYVQKPIEFDEFVRTISAVESYWLRVAKLPGSP